MRIALGHIIVEPDLREEFRHLAVGGLAVGLQAVNQHGLRDDLAYGHARIERAVRVLEYHLHLAAVELQLFAVRARHVRAVEDYLPRRRVFEPQQRAADRGFATTGFADQAHCFAAPDFERQAIDRAHFRFRVLQKLHARAYGKVRTQIAHP